MIQAFELPTMEDLFAQYRELSRTLHEEAEAILCDDAAGPRDRAEGLRLESRAQELDRLMRDYYRRQLNS